DNLWTGRAANLAHVKDRRLRIEVKDAEQVETDIPFDEIYHLASPATPLWYMTDPLRAVSANVVGALKLLKALRPGGQFCFTSSSEVYGDSLINPLSETDRGWVDCTGPRSSYNEGKRCTETILFEAHRVHNVRVKVARVFNVFGPRTRTNDGRAVSNFISQAL